MSSKTDPVEALRRGKIVEFPRPIRYVVVAFKADGDTLYVHDIIGAWPMFEGAKDFFERHSNAEDGWVTDARREGHTVLIMRCPFWSRQREIDWRSN